MILAMKNTMKRIINLSGVLFLFSLIIFTSQASAESKGTSNALISSSQKHQTIRYTERCLKYGDFYCKWHDWYNTIVDQPFYLHVNDVFIGKLILSRDNRLELSTPLSGIMMSRVTFGGRGVTVLPNTGSYNLGLGINSRMRNGLSFDTSVNFDLRDPSDMTFWLTLPAIRF